MRLFYTDSNPSPPLAFDMDSPYLDTTRVNASGHKLFNGTVLIRPITNNDSCLNGFLSESELRQQILQVNINGVVSRPRQQRLFPDIKFTCNGFITKWIIGAQIRTTGITTELPEMQIWRRLTAESTYTKVGSSLLTNGVARNSNVIEYTPVSPVEFQAGDILGVFQPRADHSKTLMYYQHGTGPENHVYDVDTASNSAPLQQDQLAYDYPLVTAEVIQGVYMYNAMSVEISFKPCVGSLTPVDVSPISLVSTSNGPSMVISLAAAVTVLFILFASIIAVTALIVMVVLKRKGV